MDVGNKGVHVVLNKGLMLTRSGDGGEIHMI